jgi:hypothetical protein
MFNRHTIESKMLDLTIQRDVAGLNNLLSDLLKQRKKMDVWFDKYLDAVEKQMKPSEPDSPVWKLYNSKFSEYEDLQASIKSVNYFREKYNVNSATTTV